MAHWLFGSNYKGGYEDFPLLDRKKKREKRGWTSNCRKETLVVYDIKNPFSCALLLSLQSANKETRISKECGKGNYRRMLAAILANFRSASVLFLIPRPTLAAISLPRIRETGPIKFILGLLFFFFTALLTFDLLSGKVVAENYYFCDSSTAWRKQLCF